MRFLPEFFSSLSGNDMPQKKITKYDLVESVYRVSDCERRVVQQVMENFLEEIKKSLIEGATIELRGFGTFEPRLRKGRSVARNPKTGEEVPITARRVVTFHASQKLKGMVEHYYDKQR